jgi:hypothetical protein
VAQINITQTGSSGVSTPNSGVVAVFSNTADDGKLYYKFSDGSVAPVDTQGSGGTGGSGTSGSSGSSGSSGTSGAAGASGSSGTSGTSATGSSGTSGSSGAAGAPGTPGSSGTSGTSATGSSGTSGAPGSSGTSGTSAPGISSGTSGSSGASGSSGTSGSGSSGTSGTTGAAGSSGISGSSGTSGSSGVSLTVTDGSNTVTGVGTLTFSGGTVSGTTPNATVTISGGGGGGVSTVYNESIRYTAYTNGTQGANGRVKLDLTSTGTLYGGLTWARTTTTLTITSTAHGLLTGDYVVLRNFNVDYVYVEITVTDSDTFTAQVTDTGGASGTDGAYIPAFGGSITESANAGEIASVTVTAPSAGSCQLNSIVAFGQSSAGQGDIVTNVTFTVPASATNGAGSFNNKEGLNPPLFIVVGADGSGTSSSVSAGLSMNLGTNYNIITITGTDTFNVGQIYKLYFF